MKNKKGLAIPVGILAVLVILLVAYTSYYVLTRERNIRGEIDVSVMDKLYVSELELNFILGSVFDSVSEVGSKEDFVEEFLKELRSYKVGGKYLINGLSEVDEEIGDSVEFVDVEGKIILRVDVELREVDEGFEVRYNYKRVFENIV